MCLDDLSRITKLLSDMAGSHRGGTISANTSQSGLAELVGVISTLSTFVLATKVNHCGSEKRFSNLADIQLSAVWIAIGFLPAKIPAAFFWRPIHSLFGYGLEASRFHK